MAAKHRSAMMEETRPKLIVAGRKAFGEQGFAATSMDELTAGAKRESLA
ncbi:TetR family transcriptional regulator [Cypionkella sp.]|jgi:AcrR family transcriptional regulator|nr:TetR family transcriptional regulator [Cypionkella sp.]MDO8982913.1 TetR family transcriptional regulator [Cypionkella sp.]MDP2047692.1 TetR family transcriptional regulator [Cypionkella sp.]